MNIDTSNAHCGFRIPSVTHAWPRVARLLNLAVCAGSRSSDRAPARRCAWALATVSAPPSGGAWGTVAAPQVVNDPARAHVPAGGAALAGAPTWPSRSPVAARTVVSPRGSRPTPLPGGGSRRPRVGGSSGAAPRPPVALERCRRAPHGGRPRRRYEHGARTSSRPPPTGVAGAAASCISLARPRIR